MLAKAKTVIQRLLDGPVNTAELNRLRAENAQFKKICSMQTEVINSQYSRLSEAKTPHMA